MRHTDLFSERDAAVWTSTLAAYDGSIRGKLETRLAELDAWWRSELPGLLRSRATPFVTREELTKITEWKMKRGEWRARNLELVKSNDADVVEATTRAAFALVPDPRKPIAKIAELSGVGPATASAVLAPLHGELYPFFDEDVAKQIASLGEVKFTVPYYLRYRAALEEKAKELGGAWTAETVGRALWANAVG